MDNTKVPDKGQPISSLVFPPNDKQKREIHRNECIRIVAELTVMKYRFHRERIVTFPDKRIEKSAGGLHIPDEAQGKPAKGTVVAIGSDVDQEKEKLALLDRVLFTKYTPILITLLDSGGEEMQLEVMHPTDVYVSWEGTGGKG